MNERRSLPCLLAVLMLCVALAPTAQPAGLESNPSSVSHLPIDDEARERIDSIDSLTRTGKWREIIDICQKCVASPSKGVLKIRKGVYGSARLLCEQKLAKLPESKRRLYRDLYDPAAQALYRTALARRDIGAARRAVREFRMTSFGPRAMDLLAGLLFERGEMRGAMQHWRAWAGAVKRESIPELTRRRTAAKFAVAAAHVGDAAALRWAIDLFGGRGSVVELAGRKVSRPEQLSELAKSLWRKPGGTLTPAPAATDFALWTARQTDRYASRMSQYRSNSKTQRYTCDAQIAGGRLYVIFADGSRCFDLLSGREMWRRKERNYDTDQYTGLRPYNFHCRIWPDPSGTKKATVFLTGGARLMAVTADTGRLLWTKTAAAFARVPEIGNDRELRVAFSSPVVCRDGLAYVIVETSRAEVFLIALGREKGDVKWARRIGGSAPKSSYRVSFPSALTFVGGDLVFCNGRGAIGNCDARSGELRWIVPYRRRSQLITQSYYSLSSRLDYSPVIVSGGTAVCMPGDSAQLIAISVADGQVMWRKDAAGRLLGALSRDEKAEYTRLITCGKSVECRRSDTGALLWTWPMPEPARGRGRVTQAGVIVATQKGVYTLNARTGELASFMPIPIRGGYGVSVASDAGTLALVTEQQVSAVGKRSEVEQRVVAALKKKSDDPLLLAVSARALRQAGKTEDAATQLEKAAQLARRQAGSAGMASELEQELVGLHHSIFLADWRAGRRIPAFKRMLRALRSPRRTPYECRLGYRTERKSEQSAHRLVMASGDAISGRLTGIDAKTITYTVGKDVWSMAVGGVDRLVLSQDAPGVGRNAGPGRRVFPVNGDRVSFDTITFKDNVFHARTGAGELTYKLKAVAAVTFGGAVGDRPRDTAYIKLRNGDRLSGTIRTFDGAALILDILHCGPRRIAVDQIHTISNRRQMPARSVDTSPQSTYGGGLRVLDAAKLVED
jgi:outer membrane protein assembly factor BamB